jgi:DNA-binding NarL/FixJ family response regulator
MLKRHGQVNVVGEAADGIEAVQKAQELNAELILLDIGLPNLNGIEAASRISYSRCENTLLNFA